jgi:hypothetical protein
MTATYNPQAAAADARANYRDVTAKLGQWRIWRTPSALPLNPGSIWNA